MSEVDEAREIAVLTKLTEIQEKIIGRMSARIARLQQENKTLRLERDALTAGVTVITEQVKELIEYVEEKQSRAEG
jgi:regulator of replication initiation timing